MTSSTSSALRSGLQKDGFIIIPNLLTPSQLTTLRKAASTATAYARSGQWPLIRTVPQPFPPWPSTPGPEGIWGVQALLHPDLPGHEVFTQHYFSDAVQNIAKEVLQCTDDDLVMELFNLLVRPERDFELRWHRDDIAPSATEDEERARLCKDGEWDGEGHTQWNLALYPDDSLVVVPGSHRVPRTPAQRSADPLDKPPHRMPGQETVHLEPGDVVFYDNNILHRGVYDSSRERMSLHGSVGIVSAGKQRARNVLQHGVREWIERCDLGCLGERGMKERDRAEGMRERLVRLGRSAGDVGFSQPESEEQR